jgi:hypothetical protein
MALSPFRSILSFSLALCSLALCSAAWTATQAQVFVVGEKSAMAGVSTAFTPTNFPLPGGHLNELGRRELVRNLESEQGFAHRALPMGAGLVLDANGPLSPGADKYKKMLYEKGVSSMPGDRVVVTALEVKGNRLILDLNGGPYAKHRFLSHVSLGDNPMVQQQSQATGCRLTLVFQDGIPDISAPEVKALLTPVIDFGAKSSGEAFADTLPAVLKEAVATHDVLVGMDRRMVMAAMGAPESKTREHAEDDPSGPLYEEWIYGHVPQTVRFVRFTGERVVLVKVAALGKPIEIHDQDETGGYLPPLPTRQIAMGDGGNNPDHPAAPPSLRRPNEPVPANSPGKVQFPVGLGSDGPAVGEQPATSPAANPSANPGTNPGANPAANPGGPGHPMPPGPSSLVGTSVAANGVPLGPSN